MKHFQRCIFILLLLHTVVFSIAQDSLVYFQELKFHSDFEKQTFTSFQKGDKDFLAMFLATDPNITISDYLKYKVHYKSFLEQLKLSQKSKKKPSKLVKTLYEEVHDNLLKKYEAQNVLSQIFSSGSYNCVSACAIYGMIFNEFSIPFTIKEKSTHVYIVAYPQSEYIKVESTDPLGGFMTFSSRHKQAYVQQLANAKIISDNDLNSQNTNELFGRYFFEDDDINLKELIGVQYMNQALYSLEKGLDTKALELLEKAHFFFSKERLQLLLLTLNIDILNSRRYDELWLVDHYIKLSRFKNLSLTEDEILGEFGKISQIHLIENNDPEKFKAFYDSIYIGINDDHLRSELTFIYSYEQGRREYNLGNYKKALPFFEVAYKQNPNNSDVARIFINTLGLEVENIGNTEKGIKTMEAYKQSIPTLINNNLYKSMLANSYLIQFGQSFDLGDEKKGVKYKLLFEQLYSDNLNISKTNVGRAYSLVAVYYFRKGFTTKAKSIINKGLQIAPGNYELLARKRMIN